jgi:hypothetical protein
MDAVEFKNLVRKVWSKEITAQTNQQKSYFKSNTLKTTKLHFHNPNDLDIDTDVLENQPMH